MSEITYKSDQKTINEIVLCYEKDQLNLDPGFQRESVWTLSDRRKLIDSILLNYPLPSIFIYRREENGELIYDVLDGKQRIESILMFMGKIKGNRFDIRHQFSDDEPQKRIDWKYLVRKNYQYKINGYELTTTQVSGDLADIIELFVRINSTGKALTKQERRKAKYSKSEFLKSATKLAQTYADYFQSFGILSPQQIKRQKHIELICELLVSAEQQDIINKKAALDKAMEKGSIKGRSLQQAVDATRLSLNRIRKMFPDLKSTRFRKQSDFYTLAVLIQKFERDKLILTDRRRNRLASDILTAFSDGVDKVREQQKKVKSIKPEQELYRDYLLTTQQATDTKNQRKNREEILRGLLESLFARKQMERFFSKEQRRMLWNNLNERKCRGCGRKLTWEDFAIDHIKPWSKGGRTQLDNAAILCRPCNSSKNNNRRRKRKR